MSLDPCLALASLLTSYGTLGTDLFVGTMPNAPNDCIALREVPGPGPIIHDVWYDVQILLRGSPYNVDSTRSKAENIRNLIHVQRPQTIGGIYYGGFQILMDINRLGRDDLERPLFSINVRLLRSLT